MRILGILLFIIAAAYSAGIKAEESDAYARFLKVEGDVYIKREGTPWFHAGKDTQIYERDIIRTEDHSTAVIKIHTPSKEATVEVEPGTELFLSKISQNNSKGTPGTLIDLAVGKILLEVLKKKDDSSKFEVKTPTSIVGVRGTTFSVEVEMLDKGT